MKSHSDIHVQVDVYLFLPSYFDLEPEHFDLLDLFTHIGNFAKHLLLENVLIRANPSDVVRSASVVK